MHYSNRGPVIFDRDFRYEGAAGFAKTPGFWVSVEGKYDWKSWCEAENFAVASLECPHEVMLVPNANILIISTLKKFDDFCSVYIADGERSYDAKPNWAVLRQIYDGLIIAPYRWERRLDHDTLWYYTWDCASGVIWNLNAIESVTYVGKKEAA